MSATPLRRRDASMSGTMLDVKVDRRDPTDLHEQVAGELRRAIADGEAKPGENGCRPPKTSQPSSASTPTPSSARSASSATRDCSSSVAVAASPSPAPPNKAPSSTKPRGLISFARKHGYQIDELVQIVHDVG